MKIIDQNLRLSAQHHAFAESFERRRHETYADGLLTSRTTLEERTIREQSTSIQRQWQGHDSRPETNPDRSEKMAVPGALTRNNRLQSETFAPPDFEKRVRPTFKNDTLSAEVFPMHSHTEAAANKPALPPALIKMIEAIESLMERMTGKPYHLKVYGYEPTHHSEQVSGTSVAPQVLASDNAAAAERTNPRPKVNPAIGERWSLEHVYREREESRFQAQGQVVTVDGRTVTFDLNLNMTHQFQTQSHQRRQEGFVLKDPLVVNFGGSPARLTVEKSEFDIDADGQKDRISLVESGSGFLALDRNGDGTINDGSELFGTQSGNGFSDLAAYDDDKNGWIDENDAVFARLQVWHKNSNGFDQLAGLMELNIGAIALHNIETPFSYKDAGNRFQGQAVSSGLFLYEDGRGAGSIQQIDLAV